MNSNKYVLRFWRIVVIQLLLVLAMCFGCSSNIDSALQEIPIYPGAIESESMKQSIPGGFMGGALKQYSTTDPFDMVVEYYTDALNQSDTEFMNHESELGRQTAISLKQKKRITTVAIQEFNEEGMVNITFMAVGK